MKKKLKNAILQKTLETDFFEKGGSQQTKKP
jgi:hypothetical protein